MTTIHTHTLDDVAGYRVVETKTNPETHGPSGPGRVIVEFMRPDLYSAANKVARSIFYDPNRSYATVDRLYSCGCVSVVRKPGEAGIA